MKRFLFALPFLALPALAAAAPQVAGPVSPLDNKTEVQVDVPLELRQHNTGGRDGSGLCVFTSIEHAARWQHEVRLQNFQADMKKEPGGGYPSKVDAMIKKYGAGAPYVQYEGGDDSILRAALKTGRLPGVTYNGHDPHYGGSIAHMVNLVYLDHAQAAILDNNFVGEDDLVWMTKDEFHQRWGGKNGWAVVLLAPPPPPPPKALAGQDAEAEYPIVPHFPIPWRPRPWVNPKPPKPPAPKPLGDPQGLMWYRSDDHPGWVMLCKDGTQIGAYNLNAGFWQDFDAATGKWGEPRISPYSLPEGYVTNFGVAQRADGERYDLNGRSCSKAEALKAIGAEVPDDGALLRLTIVGSEADTKPVLADLESNSVLSTWKGKYVVQTYDPSKPLDAPLLKCGFPTAGKPTILIQRPDGTVLHHQKDYADGAAGLELALRKTDPHYDPNKDPDRRQSFSPADLGVSPDQVAGFGLLVLTLAGAVVGKVVRQ